MTTALLQQSLKALEGVLDDAKDLRNASISGGCYEVVQCRDAIRALRATLAQPASKAQPLTCVWTEQDDDYMPGTYESACGEAWSFTDGGVAENSVRFCQGCGKSVEVKS